MRVYQAIVLALLFTGSLSALQEQTTPVKAQLKIEAGLETGFNLDYSAFGVQNYIREIGIWAELFNSDTGISQVPADPNAEAPQVAISVKNFKLALKTFSDKVVNNGGLELQPNFSGNTMGALIQDTKGNSVNVALTWKGFWLGLVTSTDGYVAWGGAANVFFPKRSGFNYTDAISLPNGGELTNAGLYQATGQSKFLLSTASLFVPDSTQWDNAPDKFAPTPTYYSMDATGAFTNRVLTSTGSDINPYDKNALTKGIVQFGYDHPLFSVDAGIGTQNFGVSLFSDPAALNKKNAANYQLNVSASPLKSVMVKASYLGGVNYTLAEGGTPFALGAMAGFSWNISDDFFLVPVAGANYLNALDPAALLLTQYVYKDFYSIAGGFKFLWAGEASAGKNAFSSAETPRGVSLMATYDTDGQINLQAALFDPAGRASLIRNLGVQLFGEMKNVTQLNKFDAGKSLWGVGSRFNYIVPAASLNLYSYLHYKLNDMASNAGQLVTRAGLEYSGIKSLVIDGYYLMGRLNAASNNLGNIVCDLKFSY